MLAIYSFVFGVIFKSRWSAPSSGAEEPNFATALFAGLLVFNIFAECVNRAPTLITANVNYVKKVIFPLEILSWVALFSALFHAAVSLFVLLLALLYLNGAIPVSVIALPLVVLPLALFALGFSWFISSLAVYLRDIGQITGVFTTVLLFLSAVFFPVSALPSQYSWLVNLNPLVWIVEASRVVLITGGVPALGQLTICTILGAAVAYLGFVWFQRSRRGFADVL
jgi:lipopolysaccharide transport system permease protein